MYSKPRTHTHTLRRTFVAGWCPIKVAKFRRCVLFSLWTLLVRKFRAVSVSVIVVVVYRLSITGNNYCNAMEIVYTLIHTRSRLALRSTFFASFVEFWLHNNNYCSRSNSNKLLPKAKGRNTHIHTRTDAQAQRAKHTHTHTEAQTCLAETETAATSSDQALLLPLLLWCFCFLPVASVFCSPPPSLSISFSCACLCAPVTGDKFVVNDIAQ